LDAAFEAENGEKSLFYFEEQPDSTTSTTSNENHDGDEKDDQENFKVACDLLRSSVPRQNLWAARTIRNSLWKDLREYKQQKASSQPNSRRAYPVTLAVSLRCLLDSQVTQRSNNGYALHSYVLQSFYLLLRMKVVADHDVDLEITNDNPTTCHAIYQMWYANDAVPSTPVDQCYQGGGSTQVKPMSVQGHDNVAYASSSSSESAVQDGESFQRDPLWTLLSKMRLIPRLANLMRSKVSTAPSLLKLPNEGVSALCGILAMISQRSAGAASAIAQHETLTSDLLTAALEENEEDASSTVDPTVALPVVILFSVVARQSDVAASAISEHTDDLLTKMLSINATTISNNKGILECQRWTLILWRTLLRYGYGISSLEMVLTMTTSQRSLGFAQWPCRTEFFSCLSTMLRNKDADVSVVWMLVSTMQSSVTCLEELSKTLSAAMAADTMLASDILALTTCLDFLRTYQEAAASDNAHSSDNVTTMPMKEVRRIQDALSELYTCEFVSRAFHMSVRGILLDGVAHDTSLGRDSEAAMSMFVSTYASVLERDTSRVWLNKGKLLKLLAEAMVSEAQNASSSSSKSELAGDALARLAWRNHSHSSILKLLLTQGSEFLSGDAALISLAATFALMGRFQLGDEAVAQTLIEATPAVFGQLSFSGSVSELVAMLLRGLTSSNDSKAQLDHSSRIHEYFGDPLTPESKLSSLRTVISGPSIQSSNFLFPVGRYWLWKVLAGSTEDSQGDASEALYNFLRVLDAACRSIVALEAADAAGQCLYGSKVDAGGKLYYVMNLCLQEEQLLDHEEILNMAEKLVVRYGGQFDHTAALTFLKECSYHAAGINEDMEVLTAEEQRLKDWLLGDTSKAKKDLTNFVNDICNAYTNYGAQYGEFFPRCVRVFLLPAFPAKHRCDLMKRLEGLLHLFTIESDDADEIFCKSLDTYLYLPGDGSGYPDEDTEWLDALAGLFPKGCAHRADMKFMESLAVCSIAGNLVRSVNEKRAGHVDFARKRLERTDDKFALACVNVALCVLREPGLGYSKAALEISNGTIDLPTNELGDTTWANIAEMLKGQ